MFFIREYDFTRKLIELELVYEIFELLAHCLNFEKYVDDKIYLSLMEEGILIGYKILSNDRDNASTVDLP